jgi:hypothetical protein
MGKKGIKMRKFTKSEDDFIRANYLIMPVTQMSAALGRAKNVAGQRLKLLGLTIPKDIIEQRKQIGRLKTGNIPANKGKKWKEFMSKEAMRNSRKTTFKKGGLPATTLYNGCITIRTDKRGIKYKFIRIRKAVWLPLQRHIWQQANGKIKRGRKIVFKDGDPMNCNINNLECLTSKELMIRNSYHSRFPKSIANIIQLRGALTRQINKHEKRLNEK